MRVLALDQASINSGWAVAETEDGRLLAWGTIELPEHWSMGRRLATLSDIVRLLIVRFRVRRLALEQIHVHRNTKTALQLAKVAGVLELVAFQNGLELVTVAPQKAREAIVGHGDATKEEVRAYLAAHIGLPSHASLDASDACLNALYACQMAVKGTAPHARPGHRADVQPKRRAARTRNVSRAVPVGSA